MRTIKHNNLRICDNNKQSYIDHQGAVAVIAIDKGKIVLVKQYRLALNQVILEIPAGKIEANESALDAAKRELHEETGYITDELKFVGKYYTTPGFSNQVLHFYYTDSILKINSQKIYGVDDNEQIKVELVELKKFINEKNIIDFKTEYAKKVIYEHNRD